jgi:hypothetical protein
MNKPEKVKKHVTKQSAVFADAARAAECDEDAARFEDRLKRVVRATPTKEPKKPAK